MNLSEFNQKAAEVKDWGAFLKERRLKGGLSQQKVANILGVDISSIKNWENGACTPADINKWAILEWGDKI